MYAARGKLWWRVLLDTLKELRIPQKAKEILDSAERISQFGPQSLRSANLARLCGLTLNNSWTGYAMKQTCSALIQYPSTPQDKMWKNEIFSCQGSRTREPKFENEQQFTDRCRESNVTVFTFHQMEGNFVS